MSATITCDGCGKTVPMVHFKESLTAWEKPSLWFQRQDDNGVQDACSRECIEKVAAMSGKTGIVMPF